MNPREILTLFKETFDEWNRDHAPRLGAALAYYTVFSVGPLLVIAIAVASLVFDRAAVQSQILAQIRGLVGEQGARFVQTAVEGGQQSGTDIIATVIGAGTLVLGALGVFGQLQDALNAIWDVAPKPGRGIKGLIKDRLLPFTMVLGTGFLLLVSLIVSTGITAMVTFLGERLAFSSAALEGINFFLSLIPITLIFALIFKYLPDAEITWSNVWVGALLTALLFVIGKFLLGVYLGGSQIGTTYGAAGSVIIVLVWIYYSAQILFFGAEFTKVYAERYGQGIVPAPDAVREAEQVRPS